MKHTRRTAWAIVGPALLLAACATPPTPPVDKTQCRSWAELNAADSGNATENILRVDDLGRACEDPSAPPRR